MAVWKGEQGEYFCHCLPFGGKAAPGGPYSPYGRSVLTLLAEYWVPIDLGDTRQGDIMIWVDSSGTVLHSAVVDRFVIGLSPRGITSPDEDQTTFVSKNGVLLPEGISTLLELDFRYGNLRRPYRKREGS